MSAKKRKAAKAKAITKVERKAAKAEKAVVGDLILDVYDPDSMDFMQWMLSDLY